MDLPLRVCMVVVLLLVASDGQGLVHVSLAKECLTQSHKFVGPCVRDAYCRNVCMTEPKRPGPGPYNGGKCVRVHDHGCFCIKNC